MYMIMRFNDQLQSLLDVQTMGAKTSTREANPVNFDEMLTRQINAQEHKVSKNNVLTSIIINSNFESSFIVTSNGSI